MTKPMHRTSQPRRGPVLSDNPLARGVVSFQTGDNVRGWTRSTGAPDVVNTGYGRAQNLLDESYTQEVPSQSRSNCTIASIYRPTDLASEAALGSFGGASQAFLLYLVSGYLPTMWNANTQVIAPTAVSAGQWNVVVGRSGDSLCDVWLNGKREGSNTTGATWTVDHAAVGGYWAGGVLQGGYRARGATALTVIWDRTLSDAEVIEFFRDPWQIFKKAPRLLDRPLGPLPPPMAYPSGASGIYALRKVGGAYASYAGSCIRLRRVSDNAESDFGFSGSALDTAAIATWLGGSGGIVDVVYDQSGNGRDASGAGAPYVADIGNGKPGIHFDSAFGYYYSISSSANMLGAAGYTTFSSWRATSITRTLSFNSIWGVHAVWEDYDGYAGEMLYSNSGTNYAANYTYEGTYQAPSAISTGTTYATSLRTTATDKYYKLNGVSEVTAAGGFSPYTSTIGFGAQSVASLVGYLHEIAFYPSELAAGDISETQDAIEAAWVVSAPTVYTLTAQGATYSLAGGNATLTRSKLLTAQGAAYSFAGGNATLTRSKLLTAQGATYSLAGGNATLTRSKLLTAQGATYSLAGGNATLTRSKLLTAQGAAYSFAGGNATLLKVSAGVYTLSALGAAYTLTPGSATLTRSKLITAQGATYSLAGGAATLSRTTPAGLAQSGLRRLLIAHYTEAQRKREAAQATPAPKKRRPRRAKLVPQDEPEPRALDLRGFVRAQETVAASLATLEDAQARVSALARDRLKLDAMLQRAILEAAAGMARLRRQDEDDLMAVMLFME